MLSSEQIEVVDDQTTTADIFQSIVYILNNVIDCMMLRLQSNMLYGWIFWIGWLYWNGSWFCHNDRDGSRVPWVDNECRNEGCAKIEVVNSAFGGLVDCVLGVRGKLVCWAMFELWLGWGVIIKVWFGGVFGLVFWCLVVGVGWCLQIIPKHVWFSMDLTFGRLWLVSK